MPPQARRPRADIRDTARWPLHPTTVTTLLQPLYRAFRAVFLQDLRVRREGDGLRLSLEDRPDPAAGTVRPRTREEQAADKAQQELALMRSELARVLDALPETRDTLRHLVFVEEALGRKGLRALYKVPLPVLKRAHGQFEGLVTNWSSEGLAALRSKMAVAVIDRESHDTDREADAYRTAAVLDTAPARAASAAGAEAEAARRRAYESAETIPAVLHVDVGRYGAAPELMQTAEELRSRGRGVPGRRRSAGADALHSRPFEDSAPIDLRSI